MSAAPAPIAPDDLIAAVGEVLHAVRAEFAEQLAAVRGELASLAATRATAEQLAALRDLQLCPDTVRALAEVAAAERVEPIGEALASFTAAIARLDLDGGAVRHQLAEHDDALRTLTGELAGLAGLSLFQAAAPRAWAQGGIGYRARAIVTHRGGLWLALRDTLDAPGTLDADGEGAWLLAADGVDTVATIAGDEPGAYVLRVSYASGRVQAAPIMLPSWTARGLWSSEEAYTRGDVVMADGCSWLALLDHAEHAAAPPAPGWHLLAMRGARGRKGEAGDRGDAGAPGAAGAAPALLDVATLAAELLAPAAGAPVRAWRGAWAAADDYQAGDLVRTRGALWLALEDHPAGSAAPGGVPFAWSQITGAAP